MKLDANMPIKQLIKYKLINDLILCNFRYHAYQSCAPNRTKKFSRPGDDNTKKIAPEIKKKDTKPKGLKTSSLTDKSHIIN